MKIAPKAAGAFLARPDAAHRAVLLYGPDSGLVRERAGLIKKAILSGSDDPFAFTDLDESKLLADPALLADELSAISLMAPKRCLLVNGGDKLTKIIETAASAFHPGAFLIVAAGELTTRSALRSWFEKEPACAALACYNDEARDMGDIIRKRFGEANIALPAGAVEYLCSQLGNDRYVTYQELDKIITYAGAEKTVSLDDIRALVDYNRDSSADDLVNAVADKNVQALEKHVNLLVRDGIAPVAYLRALQRYFNRLYAMRARMEAGSSAEQLIASARPPVFFRQVPIMTRHLHHWNTGQLARALKLLTEAELSCKTSDLPIVPASTRKLLQLTQLR